MHKNTKIKYFFEKEERATRDEEKRRTSRRRRRRRILYLLVADEFHGTHLILYNYMCILNTLQRWQYDSVFISPSIKLHLEKEEYKRIQYNSHRHKCIFFK